MVSRNDRITFSPLQWGILALLAMMILAPLLLYGPAPDPGIFYTGGRKLLHGSRYYRDILDIKPPFVYWYYAFALKLFGESFTSIRLIDFILQTIFSLLLARTVLRITANRLLAVLTFLFYGLIYMGLGPENTTQIESYTGMILLPAILLHLRAGRSGRTGNYAWAGLCYGLLLIAKPTLGLVLVGAVVYEFLQPGREWRAFFRRMGTLFGVGLLPYLIWAVCLKLSPDNTIASEISTFITERHIHQILHGGGIRIMVHRCMTSWNSEYGPALLALIVIGMTLVLMRMKRAGSPAENSDVSGTKESTADRFTQLLIVQLVALSLSCAVEFWFFPYHISRALLPLAFLAAIATETIIRFVRRRNGNSSFVRFAVWCCLVPLLIYSPLVKFAITAGPPSRTFLATRSFAAAQKSSVSYFPFMPALDSLHIPERLAGETGRHPSLFVISPNVGMIHALTGTVPDQELIHGHQLASAFTLPTWRERFRKMLEGNPPDYMLIELGDPSIGIQDVKTVEEGLKFNGLWEPIQDRYEGIDSNSSFTLYKLKGKE